jgi:hypothetical protein
MDVRVGADGARRTRIERARARARGAKLLVGAATALAFLVGYAGARSNAPGHAKRHRLRPLSAPQSFERAVRRSSLSPGRIAPPQQPPVVQSSAS